MPGSGRQRLTTSIYEDCEPFRNKMREMAREHPDRFISQFLKIKVKEVGAELTYMKFFHNQRVGRRLRNEDRRNGKPIRHFYLKSRQVGQSTDAAADVFAHTWSNNNYESLIIAHDKARAKKLLAMSHLFHKELPLPLQLMLEQSSREAIRFQDTNSGFGVMTAENFGAGRGDTIHEVHASEFAHYKEPVVVMQALEQLLPLLPGTQGIIETTALGAGTPAHKFWEEALKNTVREKEGKSMPGENPYKAYFFHWADDPLNVRAFDTDRARDETMEQILFEVPSFVDRMITYKYTPEQIHWLYWVLKFKCFGDLLQLAQEYPSDQAEAWLATGTPLFPLKQLSTYLSHCVPGTLYHPYKEDRTDEISYFSDLEHLAKVDGDASEKRVHRESGEAYIEVWRKPIPGRRYNIGADGSAGYTASDYSSAFVQDMYSLEMVAEIHGRFEPSDFAMLLKSVGTCYNSAMVSPEVNGMGLTVLSHLKSYINVYFRREETAKGIICTQKYGWDTNVGTRPGMIIHAKRLFMERFKSGGERMAEFIRSAALITELRTFVTDATGKPSAANGCHDDRCIAFFITLVTTFHELYNSTAGETGDMPGPVLGQLGDLTNPRMEDVMAAILDTEARGWAHEYASELFD